MIAAKMIHAGRVAALGFLLFAAGVLAQTTPRHEPNFDAERQQANQLFLQGNKLQALPLYQDLCRQDPTVAVFAEREGSGLIAAADVETDPAKKNILHDQSTAAFRRAKQLGDDTPLVQTALGLAEDQQRAQAAAKADPAIAAAAARAPNPLSSNPDALHWMQVAETAFAKNDTATAFADFKKAAEIDPSSYMAKLYTGDACFRASDYTCAGEWFAKAIALDPNRETAYRYWGDALYKSGHAAEAKGMYERAIVAEPYTRLSWGGLTQWATVTRTAVSSPPIVRPTVDETGPGTKVGMPQATPQDAGAWAAYAGCRADADHTRPAGSRRTAEEETRCLQAAADQAAKQIDAGKAQATEYGPGVQALMALQRAGMVECWLLLNGADQQVLHDYAAYRDAHRQLLIAYLDKYVVHQDQGPATQQPQLQILNPR
jgi:tetratricopeptide (TPR) repeat protein